MVSEAVKANIPKRSVVSDEKTLRESDPYRNHREIPAGEVREIEIVRSGNRSCMFP